jgi:hypothetical protein
VVEIERAGATVSLQMLGPGLITDRTVLKFGYAAESEKAIIKNTHLFVSCHSVLKNAFGFEVIRIQGNGL